MSDVAKGRSSDGTRMLHGFDAVDIVTEEKLFAPKLSPELTDSSAGATVAPEAALTATDLASALMSLSSSRPRSGPPVPVLMAANGSQVALSSLRVSSDAPVALPGSERPEPVEIPAKAPRKQRKRVPKDSGASKEAPKRKRAPPKENVAKNPTTKKPRGKAAPLMPSLTDEEETDNEESDKEESDNDRAEVIPTKRSRAQAPPSKPAVVKRPDGNTRTELRKAGDNSSAGNNVIVFEGDTLDILEEGECFSRVALGRKIGWINSAYLVMCAV